jgi:hypothetical protein
MFGTAVVAAGSPTPLARAVSEIAAELAPLARFSTPERFAALVEATALAHADPRELRARFERLHKMMGHDGYA